MEKNIVPAVNGENGIHKQTGFRYSLHIQQSYKKALVKEHAASKDRAKS